MPCPCTLRSGGSFGRTSWQASTMCRVLRWCSVSASRVRPSGCWIDAGSVAPCRCSDSRPKSFAWPSSEARRGEANPASRGGLSGVGGARACLQGLEDLGVCAAPVEDGLVDVAHDGEPARARRLVGGEAEHELELDVVRVLELVEQEVAAREARWHGAAPQQRVERLARHLRDVVPALLAQQRHEALHLRRRVEQSMSGRGAPSARRVRAPSPTSARVAAACGSTPSRRLRPAPCRRRRAGRSAAHGGPGKE